MPNTWDDLMKMLVRANPQDFLSFIFKGVSYREDITNEQKVRSVTTDFLCKAELDGQKIVVHAEFQRYHDKTMGRRMWEYNSIATFLTRLPVYSFALYLRKDDHIVEPPYKLEGVNGEVLHAFYYKNICLWEVPPEELKQTGMEGLLPLLPLTKGAEIARDDIVKAMIDGLRVVGKEDILSLGYAFASLVYGTEADKQWLKRRFEMFESTLEDSWFYQEIMQKGIEKGIEKGVEQGELKTLRSVLVRFVETRFPELKALAHKLVEHATTSALLEQTVDKILEAQSIDQVQLILTEANQVTDMPS